MNEKSEKIMENLDKVKRNKLFVEKLFISSSYFLLYNARYRFLA